MIEADFDDIRIMAAYPLLSLSGRQFRGTQMGFRDGGLHVGWTVYVDDLP